MVELSKAKLRTVNHEYVAFNDYCQDPLEGEFGLFREGIGGTSFITAQNCEEKLDISKTRLLLMFDCDVTQYSVT